MLIKLRGLKAWFLVSGCIGIIVALVLALVASNRSLSPGLLLTLWPASIVGLSDPSTLTAKILIGVYVFGGNFLLYGVIGTGLGLAFRLANRAR
jgi:hypothetical protein